MKTFFVDQNNQRFTICRYYDEISSKHDIICVIEVSKKKGKYVRGYYSHHYDWTVKDFEVLGLSMWDGKEAKEISIEEKIKMEEAYRLERETAETKQENANLEKVKKLYENSGMSWDDFTDVCRYVVNKSGRWGSNTDLKEKIERL